MSNYVRRSKFESDFDGDHVTVYLKPLKREDALRFSLIKTIEVVGKKEKSVDMREFIALAAEVLPRYIDEMTGLKSSDGTPVTVEEMVRDIYFSSLVAEIAWSLVAAGSPPDPNVRASLPDAT